MFEVPEGPVTINFVIRYAQEQETFRKLANQFEEENPTITVELDHQNIEQNVLTTAGLVGGSDCFEWNGEIQDGLDYDLVLVIEPFLENDEDLSESDFFPPALEAFRFQGALVGIPAAIDLELLAYNKRLFDQAGIDSPQQGWSLREFEEAAIAISALSAEGDEVYGFVPDPFEAGGLIDFLHLQGVELFDRSQPPAGANFDDPDFVKAFSWYVNLTLERGAKPNFPVAQSAGQDIFELRNEIVNSGRAGMWPLGQDKFFLFGSPEMAHVGAVSFPRGTNGAELIEATRGYYITSDTEVAQPCWEWIKFLTAQDGLAGNSTPARIQTAESQAYANRVGAALAEVEIETLKNAEKGVSRPHDFVWDWMFFAIGFLDTALNETLNGGATAEQALQSAQSDFLAYRSCIIENELVDRSDLEQILDTCLPDPDHPVIYWMPSVLRIPSE